MRGASKLIVSSSFFFATPFICLRFKHSFFLPSLFIFLLLAPFYAYVLSKVSFFHLADQHPVGIADRQHVAARSAGRPHCEHGGLQGGVWQGFGPGAVRARQDLEHAPLVYRPSFCVFVYIGYVCVRGLYGLFHQLF